LRRIRLRTFVAVLGVLLWPLASGAAPSTTADALSVQQLAPGVFVHLGQQLALDAPGHDDIANIGFIVGSRCVAVIDTGGSMRIGRALRNAIKQRTTRPICYVINTHVHFDHVLGNAAFREDRPSFVGHWALAAAIERSRDFFLQHYADDLDQPADAGQIIAPDRAVQHTLDLDLGGRHLHLQAWPTAHTDCDLTVLDDSSRTLWAGDLLFRDRLPALDGSASGWLAVIDQLALLQVQRTVPGHGPVTTDLTAALDAERRYLRALIDGVREQLSQGGSMQQAIALVAAAEKPHWLLWDSTHPHNVARVYEQLEWE
jgi:quinoprotein relay system zinc metallohydrolase 2